MKDPYVYALKLLSTRSRSEFELRKRLKEKSIKDEEIEKVVDKLKKSHLLDDKEFACEFAQSKTKRHWSWERIEKTLMYEFRIPKEYIEMARECYDEEKVINYYTEKFKKMGKDTEYIKRYLFIKGFDWNFVNRVLKELTNS